MIKPTNEYLLVEVLKNEDEGQGILLPETHKKEEFGMAEVLEVPEDSPFEVGDKVIFDTLLLISVKIQGEELKFIKFSDILAYDRPGERTTN